MLRSISTTESKAEDIALSEYEAQCLRLIGESLASRNNWWGSESQVQRSVINVTMLSVGVYQVTFRDVVGTVTVGDLQIQVIPKIPQNHFNFLISQSEIAPRLAKERTSIEPGSHLYEVVSRWCVIAAENLLKRGLSRDYEIQREDLSELRGTLLPIETALIINRGIPLVSCEFEELSDDAPLNRIVKTACEIISRSSTVSTAVRRSARSVAHRMSGIGKIRAPDMRVRVNRLTKAYSKVVPLSMLILNGMGISSAYGDIIGTSFLIRTPELIEDGLRSCLQQSLASINITKKGLMLGDTGLTANPDLIFGQNIAIGDVKYKYLNGHWSRDDLSQISFFATAFHSRQAALLGFVNDLDSPLPRPVPIGPITARAFGWVASQDISPESSSIILCENIEKWIKNH